MNSANLPEVAKHAAAPRKPRTQSTTPAAKTVGARRKAVPSQPVSAEERRRMIEVCAYFLAEQRGFTPGCHERDWFEAEARIDVMLAQPKARATATRRTTQ